MQRGLKSSIGASHSAGICLLEDYGQQVLVTASHSSLLFPPLPPTEHLCGDSGSLWSRKAPQTRPPLHSVFLTWLSPHMWCLLCLFSMFYLFRGQQTMVSEPRSNPTMTCFGFFRHVYAGIFMRGKVYAHVCICSCGGQTSVSADLLNYFHFGS